MKGTSLVAPPKLPQPPYQTGGKRGEFTYLLSSITASSSSSSFSSSSTPWQLWDPRALGSYLSGGMWEQEKSHGALEGFGCQSWC